MHKPPLPRSVSMNGPALTSEGAASAGLASGALPGMPAREPAPSTAPATAQPGALGRATGQADTGLPQPLIRLLKTAQQEIGRHVNNGGLCAACGNTFPCNRACLADLALSAM
jgi:hypothetical protein